MDPKDPAAKAQLGQQRGKLANFILDVLYGAITFEAPIAIGIFDNMDLPVSMKQSALSILESLVDCIKHIPRHHLQKKPVFPLKTDKETLVAYLYLLKWIADQYASEEEGENERSKFRHFSLLPLANGFQGNFISIDKYGLYQLTKSLIKVHTTDGKKSCNPSLPLNEVFHIKLTKNQSAGLSVQTDGVSLHVHYKKRGPKKHRKIVDGLEKKEHHQNQLQLLRKWENFRLLAWILEDVTYLLLLILFVA